MVALISAGSVGTRPVRGGLTGLLAGSVVDGYWQLAPTLGGGSNGGSALSTGVVGAAVMSGVIAGSVVQVPSRRRS